MDTPHSPSAATLHAALQELRARAEKRKSLVTQSLHEKLPDDVQRLVQDLQVHQIELEMQYEELLVAQAELEALRAQYVDLYDFAPIGYFSLDPLGVITQLNLKGSQQLGTVRQRLLGRRFAWFVAPEDRLAFQQFLNRIQASEARQILELMLQREDGTVFYALLEGLAVVREPEQPPTHCRVVVIDITRQQEAKKALEASEARFRRLFEHSSDAVVLLQDNYYLDCNDAALHLLAALYRTEVVGHHMADFFPEWQPDGTSSLELIARVVREALDRGSAKAELLMRRLTGEDVWVEAVITPFAVEHKAPLLHVAWRDVTAARAARVELLRQKEFSESLLDNSVDGILAFDQELRITAWNRVQEEFSGRSEAQVLGQHVLELFPEYAGGEQEQGLRQVLLGQRMMRQDMPFHSSQGHFESYFVPLASPEGVISGALVHIRDVTERVRLAEEATALKLRQQQEVLAAILTTQEEERKRIAEALHNGVGQLLYAAKLNLENRAGTIQNREAALSLIDEGIKATRTISHELTPGILEDFGLKIALEELTKRIPKQQLHVHLHLHGLEQVRPRLYDVATYRIVQELLTNIIKHAKAHEAYVYVVHEDGHLHISAEDDGIGFTSTAGTGKQAKGIGLAGIRNRLDLLGGTLTVDSRPGKGSIITIEIEVKN
ncbi:PAS domain S-box protein [Hymenobacter chitinivorans]|uniref:histidine kinase n=1 Tax=Hymenobacter chitinivorans DSM 11115 TaxID=1121954 RepID=A0A2M9BS80_9BACT|nr:PAS domain S-box protein [Hymenobacter chitinivorans]PJJ60820.1 PAS domain S-box-containing protein [Hymenobacter chitinivorans DSM 11115]